MDITKRLSISYYKTIATINEAHKIYLVQHIENNNIYIKKVLDIYSYKVYDFLKSHPIDGIPSLVELYEENNSLTIIEEYISGTTLRDKIDSGKLTINLIVDYMVELCEILEKLHSLNPPLIHRDIKPSNIMITISNNVILLDFNAAKYHSNQENKESDTVLLGTHGYAAPEQYGFGESSPQTDIYSVGILLKEALTSINIQNNTYNQIIEKCTKLDPDERYSSITALKKALINASGNSYATDNITVQKYPFLPPGFRTLKFWKMLIAIPSYVLIIWLILVYEVKDPTHHVLWLERLFLFSIIIIDIFIAFDYKGIQSYFPLCRNKHTLIRLLGVTSFILITTFSMLIILMMFDYLVLFLT